MRKQMIQCDPLPIGKAWHILGKLIGDAVSLFLELQNRRGRERLRDGSDVVARYARIRNTQLIVRHSVTLSKQNAATTSNEHGADHVASFAKRLKIGLNPTRYFLVRLGLSERKRIRRNQAGSLHDKCKNQPFHGRTNNRDQLFPFRLIAAKPRSLPATGQTQLGSARSAISCCR